MDRIALILVIIGAIVWGCVGIFAWNPIAWALGGSWSIGSRIVYTLVALGGLWSIKQLFQEREIAADHHHD